MQFRRLRGDLILAYAILHIDFHPCTGLLLLAPVCNLERYQCGPLNCRESILSLRASGIRNNQPKKVMKSHSVEIFLSNWDYFFLEHLL